MPDMCELEQPRSHARCGQLDIPQVWLVAGGSQHVGKPEPACVTMAEAQMPTASNTMSPRTERTPGHATLLILHFDLPP